MTDKKSDMFHVLKCHTHHVYSHITATMLEEPSEESLDDLNSTLTFT